MSLRRSIEALPHRLGKGAHIERFMMKKRDA